MGDKTVKEVDVKVATPGAAQAQKQLSGLGQALKDLNNAGKAAGLTGDSGIIGLLKGAGIAGAIKFGADAVKAGADAWRDYASGAISAHDAVLKAASGIPIIGSLVDAGKSLAELLLELSVKNSWGGYHAPEKFAPGFDFKRSDIPKEIGDETAAGKAFRQARKEAQPELNSYLEKLRDLNDRIKDLRTQALTTSSASAQIEFGLAADELEKVVKDTTEKMHRAEQGFVRNLRTGLIDAFKDLPRQAETAGREILKRAQAVNAEDRQKRIELELDIFNAKWQEEHKSGPQIVRSAPATEGRFLTGAAPGGGNTPEAQTAKNTAETNKKLDENTLAIRDLARALNRDPGQIIYLR
jgi:hypothetical protein